MSDDMDSWRLYRGTSELSGPPPRLPVAPPWRTFAAHTESAPLRYRIGTPEADVVNAALHLRRPLLVTGRPGAGKSSLAASIALELGLGDLLSWPVNSKSSLVDGLYRYDAVGRLRDTGWARELGTTAPEVGNYIRLGPLGTALATGQSGRPRVLLVDEIDKGDIDLPNDLLVVFEEGSFEIPELVRMPDDSPDVQVMVAGSRNRYSVHQGIVSCAEFPVVVMTSNGERDFPAPFLRRCVRLDLQEPTGSQLREIVHAHLGEEGLRVAEDLIATFLERRDQGQMALATDQLLNAVHLRVTGVDLGREGLLSAVLRPLEEAGPSLE